MMTRDCVKEKVLRIIIVDNLPFSFMENGELIELLKDVYLDCPPPSRKAIVDYLKSKATLTRLEMKEKLAQLDFPKLVSHWIFGLLIAISHSWVISPLAGDCFCDRKFS